MSTGRKIDFISVEDYLTGEQQSLVKREYMLEMLEARNAHNIFASNALRLLFSQLQGKPCHGFNWVQFGYEDASANVELDAFLLFRCLGVLPPESSERCVSGSAERDC